MKFASRFVKVDRIIVSFQNDDDLSTVPSHSSLDRVIPTVGYKPLSSGESPREGSAPAPSKAESESVE